MTAPRLSRLAGALCALALANGVGSRTLTDHAVPQAEVLAPIAP